MQRRVVGEQATTARSLVSLKLHRTCGKFGGGGGGGVGVGVGGGVGGGGGGDGRDCDGGAMLFPGLWVCTTILRCRLEQVDRWTRCEA